MSATAPLSYVLGIDLGVQSLGWAVVDLDAQGDPCSIRRIGVRCFESGVGSEKEIEMGKDASANAARRLARQQRRQTWRRARRLGHVFHVLQKAGLLPDGPAKTPQQRHELLLKLDKELAAVYVEPGDRVGAHLLPYRLRAKALDEALAPHALGRALYHLAQRRGFLSNKKAAKEEEEEGVVKAGIVALLDFMAGAGARTLGEYFAGLDPEEHRIRGRWTSRQMYLDEFAAIWERQSSHHAALTGEFRSQLHRAIFRQRPLKSQTGLIGRCDLEPRQRRAPMACLEAQRFRYWQKICDLEVTAPDGEILQLTADHRKAFAEAMESSEEITFASLRSLLRKLLGVKRPKSGEQDYSFNLEAGGEKKLFGNRTAARLQKVLGERWSAMPDEQRAALVQEILAFEKEDALARRLEKAFGLDAGTAAQVAAVRLEPGYASHSRKAIRDLLPLMQEGVRYATARKQVYGQDRRTEVVDRLPPVLAAVSALRNPVVCRALTELRKVVNALTREYGKPALVRIELARDMKRGRKQREKTFKNMRRNEESRDDARTKIQAIRELGIAEPTPGDILKWRLAEECNWECPYTGLTITPAALLGRNPQFDVEHILPFSRSLDNSFLNKTLCHHEENRKVKSNRTPFEAYGGDHDRYWEILQRVRRFRGDAADAKLRRFQIEEIPEGFVHRQLNDTRYMSRLAGDYLGLLFGGQIDGEGRRRVQVSAGGVTAYLRDVWDLNAVLGDGDTKERTDHRHHAVDAVTVALADPGTVALLSRSAEQASELGRRLFAPVDAPWATFSDEVRRSIDSVHVSYRVSRRVSGALHKDTNYSPPQPAPDGKGRIVQYRHVRKPLVRMSETDVEEIVDPRVRRIVQEKLQQLGGPPKKVFADVNNHPYFKTKAGRLIPIHKARVRENVATIAMGKGHRERHVAPGTNHHMEIVAVLDDAGEEVRWEGRLVSLPEAVARRRANIRVVQRDHGPDRKFKFSLAGGEYVEMEHEAGKRQLFRVTVISDGQIEFRLHTDARPITVLKKIPGARVRRSPGSLQKAKARKVAIDPLGNVLPAHD